MTGWVVIQRDGLADDARAFRTLLAQVHAWQERAQDLDQTTSAMARHVLAPDDHRTGQLVAQLLAYAGGQPLAPARLELLPFLSGVAHTLRQALDERIHIVVDVDADCPPCHADRRFLEDALLNLIVNARDAMPEGGDLWLRAKAFPLPDARAGVEISVSDTGAGMSAEAMSRAGQPFFTTKTHQALAGMGLAATNGFVRSSGGVLALHCPPSGGLTAAMRLPQPP